MPRILNCRSLVLISDALKFENLYCTYIVTHDHVCVSKIMILLILLILMTVTRSLEQKNSLTNLKTFKGVSVLCSHKI